MITLSAKKDIIYFTDGSILKHILCNIRGSPLIYANRLECI